MRLHERVAIVTECGRGETYGVVWARALAREGAGLVVGDPDAERAATVAAELCAAGARAAGRILDVGRQESCDALVALALERFGRVDVLANTHHLWHDLRADDASDDYLHRVLDYNAVSILRTARAVIPAMRAQGGGRIVSLSSIGAWQVGDRLAEQLRRTGKLPSFAYPASKVLENGLTRFLAGTLGQYGITVNAIAPGMIASPATMARLSAAERRAFVERTALRRLLAVEDTVGTLLHLASDDGAHTTGQVLVVDGGLVMLG
ncbi:MAG TPA: SDR family oxidoreductase [Candidatus Binatus sp.]|nr:SDR family oxidoreductase [Candidatus Binatus sp.]